MSETLQFAVLAALAAVLIYHFALDAAYLIGKAIEPLVRVFQRVVLGIDAPRTGVELLHGRRARLVGQCRKSERSDALNCHVFIDGERWQALFAGSMPPLDISHDQFVKIIGRDGLTLLVEPVPGGTGESARAPCN